MPKYLWEVSYTEQGIKGLLKQGGSKRRAMIDKAVKAVGGKLEVFYFAFGANDVYAIVDLPNAETAAAFSLAVKAAGTASARTVALLTPEQIDTAIKKKIAYKPPK